MQAEARLRAMRPSALPDGEADGPIEDAPRPPTTTPPPSPPKDPPPCTPVKGKKEDSDQAWADLKCPVLGELEGGDYALDIIEKQIVRPVGMVKASKS